MKWKAVILMIVLAANAALLHAQEQSPEPTTAEGGPQKSSTNWTTVSSPGVSALATPASLIQYAPGAGCANCPGHKSGCCLHRLIEWATYCPKERIGCCRSCNSCQYKGVLPLNLFFGRTCAAGSGLHATFPNPTCSHGCAGCTTGAPCGCK
jgi:hypothetical protein